MKILSIVIALGIWAVISGYGIHQAKSKRKQILLGVWILFSIVIAAYIVSSYFF